MIQESSKGVLRKLLGSFRRIKDISRQFKGHFKNVVKKVFRGILSAFEGSFNGVSGNFSRYFKEVSCYMAHIAAT